MYRIFELIREASKSAKTQSKQNKVHPSFLLYIDFVPWSFSYIFFHSFFGLAFDSDFLFICLEVFFVTFLFVPLFFLFFCSRYTFSSQGSLSMTSPHLFLRVEKWCLVFSSIFSFSPFFRCPGCTRKTIFSVNPLWWVKKDSKFLEIIVSDKKERKKPVMREKCDWI